MPYSDKINFSCSLSLGVVGVVRAYSNLIREVVVRPDFFVCGDHYQIKEWGKAEETWRRYWRELAEDMGQDIYVLWVTDRQINGGMHHHAIVSFEYPEKVKCQQRMFGKLIKNKNADKELTSIVTARWEHKWSRKDGYCKKRKRGSMSMMRYDDELAGVEYMVRHWQKGGDIQDEIFCGKSKRCRKHYRRENKCRNDYDGVFWKRMTTDRKPNV
jgi:hypothetical protein